MDKVHKPELRPWIGESINVRKFLDEWASNLYRFCAFGKDRSVLRALNAPEETINELQEICRDDLLDCDFEDQIEPTKEFSLPKDTDLETLKSQKCDTDRRNADSRYRLYVYNNSKFHNFPRCGALTRKNKNSPPVNDVVLPEVVLTVQIYRPEKAIRKFQMQAPPRIPIFLVDQEFFVLGCQKLTELRDQINCVSDFAVPGDFSEDPDEAITVRCKDLMKSGFFYIHGVFYNDMRDMSAKDYSKVIIDWAESGNRGIGPFTSTTMESTHFIDLDIKLGYPYVYMHQGNCEHLLVFSDIRLLSNDDTLDRSDYPRIPTFIPKKRTYCMACHIHTCKWVVSKNKRLPEQPYFFCDECFRAFNYDENGKKIGEFEAQRFYDRTLLV